MSLSVIILAAGQGKRMQTSLPKVLHTLAGAPLLEHVIQTAKHLDAKVYVVYGFGGEEVKKALQHLDVTWVLQEERLGTGHAVQQVIPQIADQDDVLVMLGDSPLVKSSTLKKFLSEVGSNQVGVITTEIDDPKGFGRIIQNSSGEIIAIVEEKDATEQQKKIRLINSGIIYAPAKSFKQWLPQIRSHNAQKEYYLTDVIALAVADKIPVKSILAESSEEVLGVNDRVQLARIERIYQHQLAKELMLSGVTLLDPHRIDIRGELNCASDVIIDINVIFEGKVTIGKNSKIGSHCVIKNTTIGENVEILSHCVIDGAVIDENCKVGPFARIRPATELKKNVHIGNFVEIKKSVIDENAKAGHLTYLGDAIIGKNVNIGAGTVTCNYDGFKKHQTVIGDDAFIGTGTYLVAPVEIGKKAYIATGSTITKNAPAEQLTIARAKQVTLADWKGPKNKE